MAIFGKSIKFSLSKLILFTLLIAIVLSVVVYFMTDRPGSKWGALFGSLSAGLVVAFIQFLISWQDYAETEKLKELKLVEVFYNRAVKSQYEEFIRCTNRNLDVMGVTAVRFFRDFADTTQGAPDSAKVLLQALGRGVKVRILLPSDEYLPSERKRQDAVAVKSIYQELVKRYPLLEIRYFDHTAAHSIFRMDDTCIIGPVFPLLESRNTPALHVMTSSPIALNYLNYFETEWEEAKKA